MKIICDNQEEYDSLQKTFKYLHDFYVEDESFNFQGLDLDYEMVGTLCHLYLSEDDFPNKKDFFTILNKKST